MIKTMTAALAALAMTAGVAAAECSYGKLVTAQTPVAEPAAPITTAQAPVATPTVQQ